MKHPQDAKYRYTPYEQHVSRAPAFKKAGEILLCHALSEALFNIPSDLKEKIILLLTAKTKQFQESCFIPAVGAVLALPLMRWCMLANLIDAVMDDVIYRKQVNSEKLDISRWMKPAQQYLASGLAGDYYTDNNQWDLTTLNELKSECVFLIFDYLQENKSFIDEITKKYSTNPQICISTLIPLLTQVNLTEEILEYLTPYPFHGKRNESN